MAKKLFVVRVVTTKPNVHVLLMVECLRHANVINLHHWKCDGNNFVVKGLPDDVLVFDLFPPKSYWSESLSWARMNADRMRSFGLDAECVESGTPVEVFVIRDKSGGWACYDGIEGWHFTTIRNNAKEFIGKPAAERVSMTHYVTAKTEIVPVISV